MSEWLRTGEVARMLGTSTTTVRKMAERGDFAYELLQRPRRAVWRISAASVATYRARTTRLIAAGRAPADESRLHDEIVDLRAVIAQLQDRNELVLAAHDRQVRAAHLLAQAVDESLSAANDLRRALDAQDQTLTQLLIPGSADLPTTS